MTWNPPTLLMAAVAPMAGAKISQAWRRFWPRNPRRLTATLGRMLSYMALALLATGCDRRDTYQADYAYHTPPGTVPMERMTDFRCEIRRPGATNFEVFRPRSLEQESNGTVQVKFAIKLKPAPRADETFDVRCSYLVDGRPMDGQLRQETLVSRESEH